MIRHVLVIGAQRSGTTYLHSMLDAHPQVTMARPARPEPKVFCDPDLSARGIDWYHETYFGHATPDQLLGEKSTSYLEDGAAPARAAAMLGETHVIALLRNPVERAVSNWRFSTQNGLESRPVEQALSENLVQAAAWEPEVTSVSPFAYLERGRYIDYLEPWAKTFPDSTQVLFLEELLADDRVLERLWTSLGVDPALAPDRPSGPVNDSEGQAPVLSSDLTGRLESYFEVSDRALSEHLGRTLPW